MNIKNKALFFFASSKGTGLTCHFTDIFIDLFNKGNDKGFDVYIVSESKEQNKGLWNKIEKTIPEEFILKYDNDMKVLMDIFGDKVRLYDKCIFHLQGMNHILPIRTILKNPKVAGVTTIHSFYAGRWWTRIVFSSIYSILIHKYLNKVIFLSPFAINRFSGAKKLMKIGKVAHIPFNIPQIARQYDNFHDDHLLNASDWNIIYLANFFKNKGHEKYLPALIRFVKENPDVKVWFLGEGERRPVVMNKINAAGVTEQILCPGRVARDRIPSIMNKAFCSLLLSKSETFSHAPIESLMMKVPIISTRVGVSEYFIQDYVNGISISNESGLYKALTILKNNSLLAHKLSENGKHMVEGFYCYENMLNAYFELYNSLG